MRSIMSQTSEMLANDGRESNSLSNSRARLVTLSRLSGTSEGHTQRVVPFFPQGSFLKPQYLRINALELADRIELSSYCYRSNI